MAQKKAAAGMSATEATVRAYLIEHGGAPMVTAAIKGGSVTSPKFPTPLPTLAQAMAKWPCRGHGDRKPNVCAVAKKLARAR